MNVGTRALKSLGANPMVFQQKQGFVTSWHLIGPFPNDGFKAWTISYFPEDRIVLEGVQTAEIEGRNRRSGWKPHVTDDLNGIVNMEALCCASCRSTRTRLADNPGWTARAGIRMYIWLWPRP